MRDDDHYVSARDWRAVREGETHTATRTSTSKTPESFIVGVGASGALLSGAAIVFVTLVGLVSFNVWPTSQDTSTDGNVELSTAVGGGANSTVVPLSAASGQLASTLGAAGGPSGASGVKAGGGHGGAGHREGTRGGGVQTGPAGPAPAPPSTTPAPSPSTGGGSGNSGSSGGSGGSGNTGEPVGSGDTPVGSGGDTSGGSSGNSSNPVQTEPSHHGGGHDPSKGPRGDTVTAAPVASTPVAPSDASTHGAHGNGHSSH
jgi:hypothetical protein